MCFLAIAQFRVYEAPNGDVIVVRSNEGCKSLGGSAFVVYEKARRGKSESFASRITLEQR